MDYEIFEPSEEDYAEFGSQILSSAMARMFSYPSNFDNSSVSPSKAPFTPVCSSDDKIPA